MHRSPRQSSLKLCRQAATLVALLLIPAVAAGRVPTPLPGGTVAGPDPVLLAPGLVNTGMNTRDAAMTPDGREFYFSMAAPGYRLAAILVTRLVDGVWTTPEVAPFSGSLEAMDLEPFISPDGQRFFFLSTRPDGDEAAGDQDIWVMDREGDRWSAPRNLGAPVNTPGAEYFPAVAGDGTLYFTRADSTGRTYSIFRSRLVDEGYTAPERLPEQVNLGANRFNATVTPAADRLIVAAVGGPDSHGQVDYYLVNRDTQDRWSAPVNLGPVINDGSGQSWSPYVTPDGNHFMFMSTRTVGSPSGWPRTWGELQFDHRRPGGGNPGIHVMRADFLAHPGRPLAAADSVAGHASRAASEPAAPGWPHTAGPWLGQDPPGHQPELFAPGLVSTGLNERDILFSADGRTLWYGVMAQGLVTILETRLEAGRWTEPATVPFHTDPAFACFEPTLSADGKTVLMLANRAAPGQEQGTGWANQNIHLARLVDGRWSEPVALPGPVTTAGAEYFPSLAADGTLYFSREDAQGHPALWAAEPSATGFGEPTRLDDRVNVGADNYNATVAPDESWLILCVGGHPDNVGDVDYWISFREPSGAWRQAVPMGDKFNGPGQRAASASVSPGGEFLFFSSNRTRLEEYFPDGRLTRQGLLDLHTGPGGGSADIYWVDAGVLEQFR